MARFEERKVLTLYGERGWHDSNETDYTYHSVNRGYHSMNHEINKFAKLVTIHSVSFSHIVFPDPGTLKAYRVYAEIVYSGTVNLFTVFGNTNPDSGKPYHQEDTLFYVYL